MGADICRNSPAVAKKKHILADEHPPTTVIGIASNDRVWKLASDLKKSLGIGLELDQTRDATSKGPTVYHDLASDGDFEYLFFENESPNPKTPKLARQFRFWLVLINKRDKYPDIEGLLNQLKQIEAVSLAIDLSSEKDIQSLLP